MRKTQSYQEPSPSTLNLKTSTVSNSYEFQKPIRMSADLDLFSLQNSQCSQPLFELKQNPNISKPLFKKAKMGNEGIKNANDENPLVRSLNMNQNPHQKKSFKMIPKFSQNPPSSKNIQNPHTTRHSSNVGEDWKPYRPSFHQMRNSEPEDIEGLLFTRYLNKIQKEHNSTVELSYKMNFGYRSNKGCSNKSDKVNQDSYIINVNLDKKGQVNFFGICDGHGPFGHHVSGYLKNHLTEAHKTLNCKGRMKQQICQLLNVGATKLANESKINLSYSGSTLVGCYVCPDRIYCSNVGDSRAIIGSKSEYEKNWSVWQISTDHKPSLKSQADRIIKKGGRIEAVKSKNGKPMGPLRVWLKSEDTPGLAMTRSFGDSMAAQVGVHSQPEIIEHFLSNSDRIVLVASDGVWEFLSNQQVINRLIPFYQQNQLQEACNFLQQYARNEWISKNNGEVDDISFILIFLFHN